MPRSLVVVANFDPSSPVALTMPLAMTAFDGSVIRPLIPVCWAASGRQAMIANANTQLYLVIFFKVCSFPLCCLQVANRAGKERVGGSDGTWLSTHHRLPGW